MDRLPVQDKVFSVLNERVVDFCGLMRGGPMSESEMVKIKTFICYSVSACQLNSSFHLLCIAMI